MDRILKKRCLGGQITVFLTLILLILLSFLTTAIQSARLCALQTYSERNLNLGIQGLFSQYARPLWDNYHLFMLEGDDEEDFISQIDKYQGDTNISLFTKQSQSFTVEDQTYFLEDDGAYFREQMIDYMKYQIPEALLFSDSDSLEEQQKNSKTAELLQDEIEMTQSQAELDESVQRIMWLVEGVRITNGKIKVATTFVKQLCPGEITPERTGVNNETIWKKVKSKYITYEEINISRCNRLIPVINEAIEEIEQLETKIEISGTSLKQSQVKHNAIDQSTLNDTGVKVLEEIKELENSYESNLGDQYAGIVSMKSQLIENQTVLTDYLSSVYTESTEDTRSILKGYKIRNLIFDYGDIQLSSQTSPVDVVKNSFSNGLLSLVMEDASDVSTKKFPDNLFITSENVSSSSYDEELAQADSTTDILESFSNAATVNETESDLVLTLEETKNQILEIQYYLNHFSCFTDQQETDTQSDGDTDGEDGSEESGNTNSIYQYELEYIATGGTTEKEAFSNVLSFILLQRGVCNFAYLLTRQDVCEKAHLTAAALVGFTGMEALVQLTKFAILYIYAMAEAVVDVALLLEQKEVAIWKSKQSFLVSYEELLHFNRSLVRKKVNSYVNATGLKMCYEDFVKQLLYLQSQKRRLNNAASLIQENLQELYMEDFSLSKGVCAITVNAVYEYKQSTSIQVSQYYGY